MSIKYNPAISELMDFFCGTNHCGFSESEIAEAENELGITIPANYRLFLLKYGKDKVNKSNHELRDPLEIYSTYDAIQEDLEDEWAEEFAEAEKNGETQAYEDYPYFPLWKLPVEQWNTVTEEYIIIWHENQCVWTAGYLKQDLLDGVENPPVYISTKDDYVTYGKCADNIEEFLKLMLYDAAYGWNGGERFTKQQDIARVLSVAGVDRSSMHLSVNLGICQDDNCLYFYYESGSTQELRIANKTAK